MIPVTSSLKPTDSPYFGPAIEFTARLDINEFDPRSSNIQSDADDNIFFEFFKLNMRGLAT